MTLTAVINPMVPLNLIFPLQRVICPQSRQSEKYRIVTHNFTNDNITNGKSPSYQSLVNIPPAQLRSLLRPVTEDTSVPATRTLSSVTVLPAEPAPFSFSTKNRALPACKFPHLRSRSKVGVRPRTFPFLASLDISSRGSVHSKSLTSGRACRGRR